MLGRMLGKNHCTWLFLHLLFLSKVYTQTLDDCACMLCTLDEILDKVKLHADLN